MPAGAIAGGVVGGLAVLALAGVAIWLLRRRKQEHSRLGATREVAADSQPPHGYFAAEKKQDEYPKPIRHEMSQPPGELPVDSFPHELPADYQYVENGQPQRQGLGGGADTHSTGR